MSALSDGTVETDLVLELFRGFELLVELTGDVLESSQTISWRGDFSRLVSAT